jgi:acetate kinase
MPVEKLNSKGILVLNSGSSSIKFSLFLASNLRLIYAGQIKEIYNHARLIVTDSMQTPIENTHVEIKNHSEALKILLAWIDAKTQHIELIAIGHRVVHGGTQFENPVLITDSIIDDLAKLIPLAPLHQGHNLAAIRVIKKMSPDIPQIACFDTAFHSTQHALSKAVPLPHELTKLGIRRYGFHGLSYDYISSVLPDKIGKLAQEKIIVAHLGNGASACALYRQKSVATSMGFTALEGLMMGTRTGSIDPGILLYLLQEKKYTVAKLTKLLYEESGLLGVSGISSDMQRLIDSDSLDALAAVDLFCYRAAKEMGALITALRGCDAIVFTAGIGENSHIVRKNIMAWFDWLNISLSNALNQQNALKISDEKSKIPVFVIPTNEEYLIASQTRDRVQDLTSIH